MITLLEKAIKEYQPSLVTLYSNKKNVFNYQNIPFDYLSWLSAKEAEYGLGGIKKYKSYYCNETEIVRICYYKKIGTVKKPDNTFEENVFVGYTSIINYLIEENNFDNVVKKIGQDFNFNLSPFTKGDGTNTHAGFSSIKHFMALKEERKKSDAFLGSKNPKLYALIYASYKDVYIKYLDTGDKTDFVNALDSELNTDILAILNSVVVGSSLKIIELIKSNLQ